MSDSEEDAFQSADEGEGQTDQSGKYPAKPDQSKKDEKSSQLQDSLSKNNQSQDRSQKVGQSTSKGGAARGADSGNVPTNSDSKNKNSKKQKQKGKKGRNAQKSNPSPPNPVQAEIPESKQDSAKSNTSANKKDSNESKEAAGAEVNKDMSKPDVKSSDADNKDNIDQLDLMKSQESQVIEKSVEKQTSIRQEKNIASDEEPAVCKTGEQTKISDKQTTVSDQQAPIVRQPSSEKDSEGNDKMAEDEKQADSQKDTKSLFDRLSGTEEKKTSGGWGSWGSWGSSLLSTATDSVTTFTSHVGEGFSTVLETVESTLAVPTPEELAKAKREAEEMKDPEVVDTEEEDTKKAKEKVEEEEADLEMEDVKQVEEGTDASSAPSGGSFGGWLPSLGAVSSITKVVEKKGLSLVSGGLDVLETIGKKTMDVLAEGDPGLTKTKNLLTRERRGKVNLSQLLKEAKEDADTNAKEEEEYVEAQKAHFGTLFDEYQGIAHLEALEMLSNESEAKVQSILGALSESKLQPLKLELLMIREAFQIEDLEDEDEDQDHDFSTLVADHLSVLHLGTTPDKLNKVQSRVREWIKDCQEEQEKGSKENAKDIHRAGIQSLAEITSASVGQFHKAGELLLLQIDGEMNFAQRAKSLADLTRVMCTEVGILSSKFSQLLNTAADDSEDPDSVTPLITNVYLEASNSATYLQDAFQLLLPVLQLAALQNKTN